MRRPSDTQLDVAPDEPIIPLTKRKWAVPLTDAIAPLRRGTGPASYLRGTSRRSREKLRKLTKPPPR